jgi:5-methylcytosine-specific restriction endonuclease McrA
LCCDKKRKLTADHIVPVSKGGTSNISNIQPLCGPCNSSKGAKTVDYRRETNNAGHSSRSNRSKC